MVHACTHEDMTSYCGYCLLIGQSTVAVTGPQDQWTTEEKSMALEARWFPAQPESMQRSSTDHSLTWL